MFQLEKDRDRNELKKDLTEFDRQVRDKLEQLCSSFIKRFQDYVCELPKDVKTIVSLFEQKSSFWLEADGDEHDEILKDFEELVVRYRANKKLRFLVLKCPFKCIYQFKLYYMYHMDIFFL